MTIAREAAGQPTGGQFAATAKAGAAVSLTTTQEWTAEDDHRLTELEDMDIEASKAGRAMSMAHQAELIGLREKYLGSRRTGQGASQPVEYRGITAQVEPGEHSMSLKMTGHDTTVDVDAYVGDGLTPYPAHLPGQVTGLHTGFAKHHAGASVTFYITGDDGEEHGYTYDDVGDQYDGHSFELVEHYSDALPEMDGEQAEEFHEWASEAAAQIAMTVDGVKADAVRSHVTAAEKALARFIRKED